MDTRAGTVSEQLTLARQALRAGEPQKAVAYLKAALGAAPADAEVLELLGIALAQAGNGKSAVEALRRATEADPRRASAHYNYALMLSQNGHIDDAMEEVQAALFIKPDYAGALDLQEKVAARLKDRHCRSDENFAVVGSSVNPLSQTSDTWAKIECVSCGGMNFITARTCSRCGAYLPEEKEVIAAE